jgi:GTP-binding protein HflX
MGTAREVQRDSRRRNAVPGVAIVGYTNAGKSSLLNRITGAGVLVEDALFATLDPAVRRGLTPDGREYTLTDTVGFVRRLPHQLVEAFRSTLEEVAGADVVLHVVDGSDPDPEGQLAAVRDVLAEVGARDLPELVAVNKSDVAEPDVLARLLRREPGAIAVSARTGAGVGDLVAAVAALLPRPQEEVDVLLPFDRGDLVSRVHAAGDVLDRRDTAAGIRLRARVHPPLARELSAFSRVSG